MGFDYRTDAGMEQQTLGGHKKNLVCTRTQEKGEVTPHKTDPDFPMSIQESLVEAWVSGGLLQVGALSVAVCAWDLLKKVTIMLLTSTIVWP